MLQPGATLLPLDSRTIASLTPPLRHQITDHPFTLHSLTMHITLVSTDVSLLFERLACCTLQQVVHLLLEQFQVMLQAGSQGSSSRMLSLSIEPAGASLLQPHLQHLPHYAILL